MPMCRIFMSHFIVYNLYNYYIQCLWTALTRLSARTDSRNFKASGLCVVWDCVMHCDCKSRLCKGGKGTGDQMQYILPNFEFQLYVQKLFYIQFTINQTNHKTTICLYGYSCHVFYRESESQSTRKVLFLPCSVFQHLCWVVLK